MRSILVCVSILALCAAAHAMELTLTVEEPLGAERAHEVVSGGVPLPRGAYKDPAAFGLFDGATEVPVQVDPIGGDLRYTDGSLHWVLVSFPAKLGAKEKKTFTLKDKAGTRKPANPVVVKESGDTVEMSNGIVSLTLNKAKFNGIESVSYKGKNVFKAAKAGLTANEQGSGAPTHFEYRYRGPVRTTVYMKGTYGEQKTPTWSMAITLNAGESTIHIDHNLRNAKAGVGDITVKKPEIRFGLTGDITAAKSGDSGKGSAFGWQSFTGAADLLVFMRHGGPGNKGSYQVTAANGELAVNLGGAGEDHGVKAGAHKSTEIDLTFGNAETVEALSDPLHALASCAWYSEHDGMSVGRGFGSLEDETKSYKAYGIKGAGEGKRMPRGKGGHTMYKGWFSAHEVSEGDQLRGLTVQYVRTGDRGYLDRAAAWARYWRTFLLYRSDEWTYGQGGRWKMGKFGGGRVCGGGCHFYAAGLFNYAMLTGEIDALEAAFDGAEHANAVYGSTSKRKPGDKYTNWDTRGFGRMYAVVARAYDVARNDEWRKALIHYAGVATRTPVRDPRGFTNHGGGMGTRNANQGVIDKLKKGRWAGPGAVELLEKEGVKMEKGKLVHPKYGRWTMGVCAPWNEATIAFGNATAYDCLSVLDDPEAQVVAEDVKDYSIAQAAFGGWWGYNQKVRSSYYGFKVDLPIPGYRPIWSGGKFEKDPPEKIGMDGWHARWWPGLVARGYAFTGEKRYLDRAMHVWISGANRGWWNLPKTPWDTIQRYADVGGSTKDEWVTPTAFAFGMIANPHKENEPPKAVTDLAATASGGGKVELAWTAPADQGGGKVTRYQVKWATKPIADFAFTGDEFRAQWGTDGPKVTAWNMAKNVAGEPAPQAAGKKEKMTVTAAPGTCWFAVRSEDAEPNRSALSNVVQVEVK